MWLVNVNMGVEEYGKYAIILAIGSVAIKLTASRTGEAVIKFYISEKEKGNNSKSLLAIYFGLAFDLISAIIACFFVFIIAEYAAKYFANGMPIVHEVRLFALCIFFAFIKSTPIGYFQAKSKFFFINMINSLEAIVKILGLFILVKTFNQGVVLVIYASIISIFFVTAIIYVYFIFELRNDFRSLKFSFDHKFFKSYLSFSIKTFSSAGLKAINQNGDVLILGFFTTPNMVGVYEAIKKIASVISFISLPFPFLASPKFSLYFAKNKFNELWAYVIKQTVFIIFSAAVVIGILFQLVNYIFEYMQIEYKDANVLFLIAALSLTVNACLWWGRIYSNIVNPMISLRINVFSTLFQITVVVLSTWSYGVYGLLFSWLLMNILVLSLYCRSGYIYSKNSRRRCEQIYCENC